MDLVTEQLRFNQAERIGGHLVHVAIWTQNFRKFLFLLSHEFFDLHLDFLGVIFSLLEVVLPRGNVSSENLV